MSDSVGQYLNEIGLVPLLTAAEERELSQLIEKGVEARERLEAGEKGIELKRADRKAAEAADAVQGRHRCKIRWRMSKSIQSTIRSAPAGRQGLVSPEHALLQEAHAEIQTLRAQLRTAVHCIAFPIISSHYWLSPALSHKDATGYSEEAKNVPALVVRRVETGQYQIS